VESYRLKSKLTKGRTEFEIRTANATDTKRISSTIYVDGKPAESTSLKVADDAGREEILSLVKGAHERAKGEIEALLDASRHAKQEASCKRLCDVGAAFFYKDMYAEAVELFAAAIEIDPVYHRGFDALSQAELAQGMVDQAVEHSSSAVELRPKFADYHNNFGLALMAHGDYSRAASELKEALAINMYYADAQLNLGLLRLYTAVESRVTAMSPEQISQIKDCFDRAASIDSDYRPREFDQLVRSLETSDLHQAMQVASVVAQTCRGIQRRKKAPLAVKAALATSQKSNLTLGEHIQDLELRTRKNPSYVDLQRELAVCYLQNAVQCWEKGIKQFSLVGEMNPSLKLDPTSIRGLEQFVKRMRASVETVAERE